MTMLDRRLFLAGLAVAPALWARAGEAPAHPLLDILCDATIPDTDTKGAKAAGVPGFVGLAVAHGLNGAAPDTLDRLAAALDRAAMAARHAGFLDLPPADRLALLGAIDRRVLAGHGPPDPALGDLAQWAIVKGLIVMGYYTSEVGGAEELQYVLVPGRWQPDLPMPAAARAFSSDWTALEFG